MHRGPHPEDATLFAPGRWSDLRAAVADLAWLLSRDYSLNAALKLVGDRFNLTTRQRLAVMRSTCSDASLALRSRTRVEPADVRGQVLLIDGYNVLTTIEAALGGAVLLRGRDGCLRDLASMHGHYKRVKETARALEMIGQTLADLGVSEGRFLLDAPVSNSGRLRTLMLQLAAERRWPWTVTLVPDPDPQLGRSRDIIATADSVILDGVRNPAGIGPPRWVNLARHIQEAKLPAAVVVGLDGE
jgi:hypothetical protein